MSNAPTVDLPTFHTVAVASGLVTTHQWSYLMRLAKHRAAGTAAGETLAPSVDARCLADLMIEQGWATPYQADQLLIGRSKLNLGPYLIVDWIGQGGMGQVFKATHRFMDRLCAVKVLPTAKTNADTLHSFMREIRLQAQLDHRHLVRAYDAGQDGNVHFLVTEYIPGMDLRRLVRSHGPLSPNQAASIVMQAALGLQYAHEQGLVHRDVKPGNILVTPEGIAKVSDIGLAGLAADLSSDPRAGKVVGTADYISPEQIRSPLEVTPASDVYSLGCTLYYAVCGKVPFPGGNSQSKLKRHLNETPWHPRKFAPALSDEFIDIIADMMDKDPLRRTQTCAEVAARLEPWAVEGSEVPTQPLGDIPWLAPPLPSGEAESEPGMAGGGESLSASAEASRGEHSGLATQSSAAAEPPGLDLSGDQVPRTAPDLPPLGPVEPRRRAAHPHNLVIVLTLAIAVPPALLLGFILGYLFAG